VRSNAAAKVGISLRGVPFSMMSLPCCSVRYPARRANMETSSLVLMQLCILGGVSWNASVNMAFVVSFVFLSYVCVLRSSRVMRFTVSVSVKQR
jgi:hypothetical protein